jgi:hypothetical protein
MTSALLRLLEHVHGHLGWLTVAALLHPAIILRRPARRARLSVALATAFALVTASLGGALYPEYRARLKQALFLERPDLGWWFERKEHLAVGALGLALAGCVAHLGLDAFADEAHRALLAKIAHRAYVAAFLLAAAVAVIGVAVATHTTF